MQTVMNGATLAVINSHSSLPCAFPHRTIAPYPTEPIYPYLAPLPSPATFATKLQEAQAARESLQEPQAAPESLQGAADAAGGSQQEAAPAADAAGGSKRQEARTKAARRGRGDARGAYGNAQQPQQQQQQQPLLEGDAHDEHPVSQADQEQQGDVLSQEELLCMPWRHAQRQGAAELQQVSVSALHVFRSSHSSSSGQG